MSHSPDPPAGLAELQAAFAKAASTPLRFDQGHVQLDIEDYDLDLVRRMGSQGELTGVERLGTYNRQYWFRLFGVMQEEFPLLQRLMTVELFNQMASDYLTIHPSRSPTLRDLSLALPAFLEASSVWGRPLWIQCAQLETLFIVAFDAAEWAALRVEGLSEDEALSLLERPLVFQPHWGLFQENWNLVSCRKEAKLGGHAGVDPEPNLGHWAVYRGPRGVVAEALGAVEWALLVRLAAGESLGPAVEAVARDLDPDARVILEGGVQRWFSHWRALGWFAQVPPAG